MKDGSTLARGYGLADIENQINATESTIFCLGSVTKSMTAMLLARLMSTGEHDRYEPPEVQYEDTVKPVETDPPWNYLMCSE